MAHTKRINKKTSEFLTRFADLNRDDKSSVINDFCHHVKTESQKKIDQDARQSAPKPDQDTDAILRSNINMS